MPALQTEHRTLMWLVRATQVSTEGTLLDFTTGAIQQNAPGHIDLIGPVWPLRGMAGRMLKSPTVGF